MKHLSIAAVIAMVALMFGMSAGVSAQGTPTPTLQFENILPSPTAIVLPPSTPLPFIVDTSDIAYSTINMYRFINQGGIVDALFFVVMFFAIFRLLWSIIRSAKQTTEEPL